MLTSFSPSSLVLNFVAHLDGAGGRSDRPISERGEDVPLALFLPLPFIFVPTFLIDETVTQRLPRQIKAPDEEHLRIVLL